MLIIVLLTLAGCSGGGGGADSAAPSGAPVITTQPVSQIVTVGNTATFTVSVTGTTPFTYQWRKDNIDISGATSVSYNTPVTIGADDGAKFSVVVTNSVSSVTSSDATLIVNLADGLRGWQVNATNAGLTGVGVDKTTLPVYSGTNPIPSGSTISMKKLIDPDFVNGNITIDRCWIVLTGNPSNSLGSPNGIDTVRDSDIEATHYQGSPVGTGGTSKAILVLRCNISGGQGLAYMNGPGTVQQSYLHGMISAYENHCDGFTRRYGTEQVNFIDNHLDSYTNPNHTSAAIFLQDNDYFDNILFQGNLIKNGSSNYGSAVVEKKNVLGYGTHLIMDNNRFYPANGVQETVDPVPGAYSHYGATLDYTTAVPGPGGPGWGQWTNNYVYDPSKPDSKGALILEPLKTP